MDPKRAARVMGTLDGEFGVDDEDKADGVGDPLVADDPKVLVDVCETSDIHGGTAVGSTIPPTFVVDEVDDDDGLVKVT